MFELDIPGFGMIRLNHLVSDYTGTLSFDGRLIPGVRERLIRLSEDFTIHILTSDTFGTAREQLHGIPCTIHILEGEDHDVQKEEYVRSLGPDGVVAFGNGNNDRRMLKIAKIGIAVTEGEGGAVDMLMSADIHVTNILNGLDLLLYPKRLKATLRF